MSKHLFLLAAVALAVSSAGASAQDQPSLKTTDPPIELQGTPPNKPAVAKTPEAVTDVPGVTRGPVTSGQAPNVSRRMGAEMESAGDQRAAPDEQ
jgi:hypothetical protein